MPSALSEATLFIKAMFLAVASLFLVASLSACFRHILKSRLFYDLNYISVSLCLHLALSMLSACFLVAFYSLITRLLLYKPIVLN